MAVTLDIEKGDILLGGRFKNHKTVVDTLGTDSLGQPTVNGMKLLSFRIAKKMPKEANMNEYYVQGFIDKCAEHGVDSTVMLKQAQLAWGGKSKYVGQRKGIGAELGYTYGMGIIPLPYAGLRIGGPKAGVTLGVPSLFGMDNGRNPGKGFEASGLRSVWKILSDKLHGSKRR